jgi:hypothetical protein
VGTVRVTLEQRGAWLFLWVPPGRGAFERELEQRIPGSQWDSGAAAWRVHVAFTDFALALAEKHFPDALPLGDRVGDDAELAAAFAELHLATTAPAEVVEAACHALLALYRAHAGTEAQIERVGDASATILRHLARRDRESLDKLASTPWPDDG